MSAAAAWVGARGNVKRFRGGLVFKAHRLLHHSTLGLRVIKKKKVRVWAEGFRVGCEEVLPQQPPALGTRG